MHIFVQDCVVATTFAALLQLSPSNTTGVVSHSDLLREAKWLSQLMKLEFVYAPSSVFEDSLNESLQSLMSHGILERSERARDDFRYHIHSCV